MKTLALNMCALVSLSGGLILCPAVPVSAADFEFRPSIAVGEEYTDNVYENPTGKRNEFITLITPGFSSKYESVLWRWNAAYSLGYKHYAKNSGDDEYNNNAQLNGNITLVENFFYLDVSELYQLIYTDIARDQTTRNSLNNDQTKQNTAAVSPYLNWRLSEQNTLKTGYRFTDIRYWGEGYGKNQHDLFANLTHEFTSRFSISAGYRFSYEELIEISDNIKTNEVNGGFRYTYADKSSIYATVGNNWQKYSNGGSTTFISWNAGIIHDFSSFLATLETSSQTTEDPLAVSTTTTTYKVKLDKESQRGAISFSGIYSEYEDTESKDNNDRKLAFTGSGRYEVSPNLTPNLSVTVEHYDQGVAVGDNETDYPYHLSATAGVNYAFMSDLTLGLTYYYDSYRNGLNDTDGSTDINRVVVELKKVF